MRLPVLHLRLVAQGPSSIQPQGSVLPAQATPTVRLRAQAWHATPVPPTPWQILATPHALRANAAAAPWATTAAAEAQS